MSVNSSVRQGDLARALKAFKAAGLEPSGAVIEPGRIVLRFDAPDQAGALGASENEWDEVFRK